MTQLSAEQGIGAKSDLLFLDPQTHATDGRVPFYRGEIYVNEAELSGINAMFSKIECGFGTPFFIEVKSPPLIFPSQIAAPSSLVAANLPIRSTRVSATPHIDSARSSVTDVRSKGGKSTRVSEQESAGKSENIQIKAESKVLASGSGSFSTPRVGEAPPEVPFIPMNSAKMFQVIANMFSVLSADGDYACLFDEFIPGGLSPPITMSSIQERVQSREYSDHFQFCDDLVSLAVYWLQGPPVPNPLLPQYVASLKLIRCGTDLMISKTQELSNEDYYTGPDVETAIKEDIKREQIVGTRKSSSSSMGNAAFARKVRKTETSNPNPSVSNKATELKNIEEQVAMLTQHVLGMQGGKSKGDQAAKASSTVDIRPLSIEEIRRLEGDLMKMSAEDIDFVVTSMLKDEPSVRIDDESYELDVSALPAAKQRAIRRFVTRRLNLVDPSHEAQKLKHILKQDELAKASEEIAEQLLAAASLPPSIPVKPTATTIVSPEDSEAERQRAEREKKREEEARRLWKLAHGGDDDDSDGMMDVDQ